MLIVKSKWPAKTVHQPLDWISPRGRNEVIRRPIVGSSQTSAMRIERDVNRGLVEYPAHALAEVAGWRLDRRLERGHWTTRSARKRRTLNTITGVRTTSITTATAAP